MITVYGKPGCGLCEKAKEKLDLLKLTYDFRNLFDHDNWRQDERGYRDALARHAETDLLPIITVDDQPLTYPEAMALLRRRT